MLFKEILDEKYSIFSPYFDELFTLVLKNQTHSGDLLLIMENASLSTQPDFDNPKKLKNYYNIGIGMEGHAENTNHNFIGEYVKNNVVEIPFNDYLKLCEYSQERSKEIDMIVDQESISIQIEMLIYLKIWEGETFLKKWYQLSRLICGEDYDWHLKIVGYKNKKTPFNSYKRGELLEKIGEKLENKIPRLKDCFTNSYRAQLRNAIAHSQYFIVGRNIIVNNYDKNEVSSKSNIEFNTWINVFHETIVLFTLYDKFFLKVKDYYFEQSKGFSLKKEIRVNRLYPIPNNFLTILYSREFFKDWNPYPNS